MLGIHLTIMITGYTAYMQMLGGDNTLLLHGHAGDLSTLRMKKLTSALPVNLMEVS